MIHDNGMTKCSHADCSRAVKNHKWGHIKAEGWLFQQNGDAWCPDHLPEWYEEWKARKDGTW